MFIRTYRCPPDSDECYNLNEEQLHPLQASAVGLVFALCATLNRRVDRQAYSVGAYFYPDLERFQAKQIEASLGQILAGEMPPGEVDMANFIEGSPFLAGHLSVHAHAIFKLVVGLAHAEHNRVCFSPGDCADIVAMFDVYEPILTRNGFPSGPVGRAVNETVGAFRTAANEVGGFVEVSP